MVVTRVSSILFFVEHEQEPVAGPVQIKWQWADAWVPLGGPPMVILEDPQRRPWARSLLASLYVGKGNAGCPYAVLLEVGFTLWKFSGSSPPTLSEFSNKTNAMESQSLGLLCSTLKLQMWLAL